MSLRGFFITVGHPRGVPRLIPATDIVPNAFYVRMTPILSWNYPVRAATAVLAGLVVATYVRVRPVGSSVGATAGGGLLSFFAVGCPICNKLVVALIGVSGALSFVAPIQPYLALVGLALLMLSLVLASGQSRDANSSSLLRTHCSQSRNAGADQETRRPDLGSWLDCTGSNRIRRR